MQNERMNLFKNILVIDFGGVGDLVLSIPFLRGVKASFPGCSVSLLCAQRSAGILKGQPYFDYLYYTDMTPLNLMKTALKMRGKSFDMAVNLMPETSWPAAGKMYIFFKLVGSKVWAGRNTEGRGFFYDLKLEEEKMQAENEVILYGKLLQVIGGTTYDETLEYHTPESARAQAAELLRKESIPGDKPLIAVNPGSDWPSKRWPIERYAELLIRLRHKYPSVSFVIIGTEKEFGLGEYLKEKVGSGVNIISGQTSLETLPAVFQHFDLLITNDSGPSHMAKAVGLPVVTLVGPGEPGYAAVKGRNVSVVLKHPVKCSPCVKKVCHELICWRSISVNEVFEAVSSLMNKDKEE